ncbi:MAG: AAA family ATPase [Coriobacteriales bacterium]|jgi:predicted AAA+ superfamily ATPase|nr:AAA family ATPase [Coriobacteriales bacterium]
MQRLLLNDLIAWKSSRNRKPLLLYGARQTGKSWLLSEFGRSNYEKTAAVDLTESERMRQLFAQDYDTDRIIAGIKTETGVDITPGDTLVIIDEIQESPRAITALKYLYEKAGNYHIAAAGSLMGLALHEGSAFPVGKVDTLTLHPLSFLEFLTACGAEMLATQIAMLDFTNLEPVFAEKLASLLREYLYVGGMPEVVADFAKHRDCAEARRLQRGILNTYDQDFSKHAPLRILERIRLAWASIPAQLAKENRKFVYGYVREGARGRDFEESIQWLVDYGVADKVCRVSAIKQPLAGYEELEHFKLFTLDVGLTSALANLDAKVILEGSSIFTEFKGALTEQYVQQQLRAVGLRQFYWSPDSRAEVDLVTQIDAQVLPIEVKATENLRSKSLKVATEKYKLPKAMRTSLSAYREQDWLINIPLWAIGALPDIAAL